MKTIYGIILFALLFVSFTDETDVAHKSKIKMHHLYIPDRDLRAKNRIMKQENKQIKAIYSNGKSNTYKMVINEHEVHEDIFTLEIFFPHKVGDFKDAARNFETYNTGIFILYHNQNGFFPINGNEYYYISEQKNKIYQLIPDGQIHEFTETNYESKEKLLTTLCNYNYKIYTVPEQMCK